MYKRVHILRLDGVLRVYGSTCFAREFAGQALRSAQPHFTGAAGCALSPEERELLVANTERLIERFEAERQVTLEQQRNETEVAAAMRRPPPKNSPSATFFPARHVQTKRLQFSPAEQAAAEPEALRILNAKFPGQDFHSPGFNGLLQSEIDRILRERTV